MQIIYCETCGHRIPQEDIDAGRVVSDEFKHFCQNCIPRAEPQRPAGRSSRRIVLITPAPTPAALAVPTPDRMPSKSHLTPATRHPSHPAPASRAMPMLPVAVGIGLFVIGALAVFSLGSSSTVKKPDAPIVTGPPSALASVVAPETTSARKPQAPVKTGVAGPIDPATPDPQKVADDALTDVLRWDGVPESDSAGRIKRLEEFIARFGESNAAARAQLLLVKLHAAPAAGPISTSTDVAVVDTSASTAPGATQPNPPLAEKTPVDDTPTEVKPVDGSSKIAIVSATATPEINPEREAAALRDWAPVVRLADARSFKGLDDALNTFTKTYVGAKFLDEHSAEIRAVGDFTKAATTVDSGMAGWWKFDEGNGSKTADASGNNNAGVLNGKPIWGHGKYGNAIGFNGLTDFVNIPNSPSVERIQEGEYTLSAWAKPEDLPNGKDTNSQTYTLIAKAGFHSGLFYERHGNFIAVHMLGDNGQNAFSYHAYAPKVMHHVAMTVSRSGGVERLYVDGVQDGIALWNRTDAPRDYGQETWKIGMAQPGNKVVGFPFKGVIDDVRIYNRVLTPAEIAVLAEIPFKKFAPPEIAGTAKFIGIDENTHGTWKGVYGGNGHLIPYDSHNAPAYAQVLVTGESGHIWGGTKDPRGLMHAMEPDRVAACWFSDSSFTVDVNLTDGHTHRIAFYCIDWDSMGRAGKVDVMDLSGNVLDSHEIADYAKGKYMIWDVKGHVKFVCRATKSNFTLGGVFFNQ